jgi:hypothetical protein
VRALPLALLLVRLLATPGSVASAGWSLQLGFGGAWNAPMPLVIRQSGREDLRVTARYDARPLEAPPYYVVRIGRWAGDAEWSLELVHHKLYLSNPPPDVDRFSVSHGYNLILLGRTLLLGRGFRSRIGGGMVIAHPESRVRGEDLPEDGGPLGGGYHLSGVAASADLEWPLRHRSGAFLSPEARLTAAWARVPVARGDADVPSVAVHGTLVVGFESGR